MRGAVIEKEANAFAMELLMPEAFLREDIGQDGIDVCDEVAVAKLAKKYQVPVNVMAGRLVDLHFNAKELGDER
ncbi:ImmA/IrrE family metallo-endopeptidase [Cohaesibacter gelatinilyticus]|uniref:IrrE N-terminal-like domain-containing protein n=1 Tax=Cohaesibacter gelatinilyticus TaxID=372072 RepID=A0A285PK60_9HYPH|nr:ImmA/IrrE family metallo-endopeptidase [Cohaesibacter gelatinilyticus]SNZ21673.1 protein of unknown function [Cohaesibacter gelatinilyticus]